MPTTAAPAGRQTSVGHKPSRTIQTKGAPWWSHWLRNIREELTNAEVTEVYVHTTEQRGREDRHATDYEAPLENFIDIDTTGRFEEDSLKSC